MVTSSLPINWPTASALNNVEPVSLLDCCLSVDIRAIKSFKGTEPRASWSKSRFSIIHDHKHFHEHQAGLPQVKVRHRSEQNSISFYTRVGLEFTWSLFWQQVATMVVAGGLGAGSSLPRRLAVGAV